MPAAQVGPQAAELHPAAAEDSDRFAGGVGEHIVMGARGGGHHSPAYAGTARDPPPRRGPVTKASPYSTPITISSTRYPVIRDRYSSAPPTIAPRRLTAKAVPELCTSANRCANTRFARNTGAKARALAALPGGDNLSFTTLQDLIGLTPGNLITHLRKLEDAGYVTTAKNGSGVTARTSVALTGSGRAALERYTATLRQLLDSASQPPTRDALPNAPA